MKRRFTLLAIAAFMSTTVIAQPTQKDGKYQIATKADLVWLAEQVNGGNDFSGEYFEQIADIDLGGIQNADGTWKGTQWIPIGNNSKQFSGTYDGAGNVINNIFYSDSSTQYVGLFGGINNATLTRITVASGYLYGYQCVGGICGYSKGNSRIELCANNATIFGKMECNGGILGFVDKTTGTTTISNCINYGLISAFNFSAGIFGYNEKEPQSPKIYNCVNVGQVFGMRVSCGNIIGYNEGGIKYNGDEPYVSNCYYDNQINTVGAMSSDKTKQESDADVAGIIEGKATSELIGENLKSVLGDTYWHYETGMYPRPKCNQSNEAIIVAATPVILNSGDKADCVTKNFTATEKNGVKWTSGEPSNLSIHDGAATINKSTAVVLIATKGVYTKKVYLKTTQVGTPIGSESSPLTIESETDLENLRKAVNNYGSYKGCANYDGFKGIHFIVTEDIDLSNWTEPIGIHNSFKGIFDGNYRTIKGINVNQPSLAIVGGLFGCASYGEIKNITIISNDGQKVCGVQFVGGICGSTYKETLTKCISKCTVEANTTVPKNYVGGIVGVDKGYSEYIGCENNGSITGNQYIGGILGASNMGSTFDGCKNYGTINNITITVNSTANVGSNTGGICANPSKGCIFRNCQNHGAIVSTGEFAGGIAGQQAKASTITIEDCINTGSISGSKGTVGGIIGQDANTNCVCSISNCLNMGTISGSTKVGGIAGNTQGQISISNCFNSGSFNGSGIASKISNTSTCSYCINIGKVTGNAIGTGTSISDCFNDNQMCLVTGGTSKKTSEITGDALKSTFGEENWTFSEDMYPMIKTLANSDYMIVAATAIILDDADKINSVNNNFTFGNDNDVEWTCNYPHYISFASNGTGYLTYYIGNTAPTEEDPLTVTVTKTVNSTKISKTIPLTLVAKAGKESPNASLSITPNSIVYGTELSEGIVTATVSEGIQGEWEFSIAMGTKPHAGPHTLTATFIPTGEYANTHEIQTVSADFTVTKKEPTIEWSPENITYGAGDSDSRIKTAVAKDGDVKLSGIFTYNIPPLTPGEKTVTVTFSNADYEITTISAEKNTQKTITVNAATPSLTWSNPSPIEYGTPLSALQLGAVSGVEGHFEYFYKTKDGSDSYQSIEVGDELEIGTYTLKAVFAPTSPNYESGTFKTVTLEVTKATPTITWSNPNGIVYGTELSGTQLNANVTGINGATITGTTVYEPTAGTKLDASSQPQTLRCTFTPTGDDAQLYKVISKEVEILVGQATPEIEWNNPTGITYGTPLSGTQLNANVAGVDGNYTYTPAFGHKLNAGNSQILRVDFTPNGSDANNYKTASKEVRIDVGKADVTINWDNPANITYGTLLSNDQLNAEAIGVNGKVTGEYSYNYNVGYKLNAGKDQELTVNFTPTGDDAQNYNVPSTKIVKINVDQATPEITWNITDFIFGAQFSELPTATANVGGSFEYKEGNNTLADDIILTVGNHTLTAAFTPTDEVNYKSTSKSVTITVSKNNPTLTWSNPSSIIYGTPLSSTQLCAITNSDGEIVYKENGVVVTEGTILEVGFHTITATLSASNNYNGASVEATIEVTKATPTITWNQPAPITYGTPLNAEDHLSASSVAPGTITYKEGDKNVNVGDILPAGSHTITATLPKSDNYFEATAEVTIFVNTANPNLSWTPAVTEITYGDALSANILNATTTTDGTIIYKEDNNVVTLETKLKAGSHTISAILPASDNYDEATVKAVILVKKATPSITWEPDGITFGASVAEIENAIKTATAEFNNATLAGQFDYNIPSVTRAGSLSVGLTFTPNDDENFNTVEKTTSIVVAKATPVVEWAGDEEITITYGTALSKEILNATPTGTIVGKIKYQLENQIDAMGFTPDAGNHVVTAILEESANYLGWSATKTILVNQAEPVITWEPEEVAWGASEEEIENNVKNAVAKDAKGNVLEGKFTYVIPELNAVGEVEVSVTFENKNYKTAAATTKKLNVTKAYPVITWTPQSVTYGASVAEMLSLDNAEASYNGEEVKGSFAFDNLSTLHAGTQNINVTFTPENTELFNPVVGTAELTVLKATPAIEWNPKEEIAFGTALNDDVLNAKANVDGTFKYEPTADSVLKVGSLKITATFTPTDAENYENATASVEINVVKANPVITWNTPEDITVGTALTDAQLNATANVKGDFAYTPAKDAVLEVGEHQKLTVLFTPADAENYNSVSDSVFINVAAAANDTTTTIDSTAAIVWVPSEIVYGTPVGETFNAVSKIDGKITYSLAADSILDAGEYKVIATLSPVNGNDTTIERIVKVAKAELTATAANDTIVQGDTMPKFEINYKGFVGNDNVACLTTAPTATCSASTDSVGSFDIVVSGGEAINYNFVHINGLLVVLAKGDTLQPIDTIQPIDTVQPIDTLLPIDTTGVAIITWAPAANLIAYGTLIDSTILNATANIEGKFSYTAIKIKEGIYYADSNIVICYMDSTSEEPMLMTNDTIIATCSLAIGDTLNAGVYNLVATFQPADTTLSTVSDTITLTVNKVVLEVTVADVTINQGDAMPEFAIKYNGFVLGENESNLTSAPVATCNANTNEAGTYNIEFKAGIDGNYEFVYKDGTLTVLKKDDDVAINETATIFEVYPNPSNGAFFVNAGNEAQEVRIFNSTGKLVKVETIEGVTRIDISEYADGMYFVKLGNQTKTIIKQ